MYLKTRALLLVMAWSLVMCNTKSNYDPIQYLSVQEQDDFKWKIIHYIARPPEGLTFEERFYKGYDDHYHEQMGFHSIDALYKSEGTLYFLLSRRAPSMTDKRVAIGGRAEMKEGNVVEYEEVFRTWKMTPDTLVRRSIFLFDKMVKGEDLTPYYTKNIKSTDYIEFPDEQTYFDKESKTWKTRN